MYLPQCSQDNGDHLERPNNFTSVISCAFARDEALKLAVIALGTAMLGKVHGEEEWTQQGRKMYGLALQETRKALMDANRVRSEALLLVPRVVVIFEILFGADMNSTMQAQSWRSHAQGELAIIKARTPNWFQDDLVHQIFVDGRLSPIIAAIRTRKASEFDSVEWKTMPWDKRPKTPKDSLLDILVGIPEILEDIDNLHPKISEATESTACASIALKCRKLEAQLQSWATVHGRNLLFPDTDEPVEIAFSGILTAHLTLYYWTACLYIYGALEICWHVSPLREPMYIVLRIQIVHNTSDFPSYSRGYEPITHRERSTNS
ncbi:hypothetical protein SLS60_010065 [Paraconiothyrium brasiliense]|uniref:Uncharacterized protein n=1 Tax=Paraconiothyrium brasiliense TaxID=300254 RepID=A0ABR3QQ78_9PLEO